MATQVAISKGILTAADVTARIERLEGFGRDFVGAAIVARAWVDEEYRKRLLDDGITAAAELGAYTGGFPARGGVTGPQPYDAHMHAIMDTDMKSGPRHHRCWSTCRAMLLCGTFASTAALCTHAR